MKHNVPTISLNILEQTHTLIGGTTGCGKSTLLHSVIYTGLALNTKWFILIDPKRTELNRYKKCSGVIEYANTHSGAEHALDTALSIMRDRQRKAEKHGWSMYHGDDVYVIIDELADLMLADNGRRVKAQLQELVQVARSARIHIIACTQSPSRATIPAPIQVNMTCVCAMACRNAIESRQLIGVAGCEQLPLPYHGEADQQRLMYVMVAGRRDLTVYDVPYIPEDVLQAMINNRPRKLFERWPA